MKNPLKITIGLSILTLVSCIGLEEKPQSSLVSQQFYKTEADAIAAVNAVYADLNPSGQSLYNSLFQIGVEMATDDYMAGPRARNAHVRAISSLIHDSSNDRSTSPSSPLARPMQPSRMLIQPLTISKRFRRTTSARQLGSAPSTRQNSCAP